MYVVSLVIPHSYVYNLLNGDKSSPAMLMIITLMIMSVSRRFVVQLEDTYSSKM